MILRFKTIVGNAFATFPGALSPHCLLIFILVIAFLFQYTGLSFAFSLEDERKLGKEFYDKLEKEHLLLKDARINEYIDKVGQRILSQTDQPLFEFRFSVIDSSAINAFATPGGYVYINKGLITIIDTESELAGVIAHEIAHINARHVAQMIERSKTLNIASLAAILAGALLGGGGTAGEAAIGLSLAASSTLQLKFSRANEEEADRNGMFSLVSAGYDGRGMIGLLKAIKTYEFYSSTIPSYFLTHPGTDDRIHYIDGLMQTRYKSKGSDTIIGGLGRIQALLMLTEKDANSSQSYFQNKLKKIPGTSTLFTA